MSYETTRTRPWKYSDEAREWAKAVAAQLNNTVSYSSITDEMVEEFATKFNPNVSKVALRLFIDRTLNPEKHARYYENWKKNVISQNRAMCERKNEYIDIVYSLREQKEMKKGHRCYKTLKTKFGNLRFCSLFKRKDSIDTRTLQKINALKARIEALQKSIAK